MRDIELKVEGMVCNGCENRVKNALKNINGVEGVNANYTTGIVKVTTSDDVLENTIKEKIEDIGFEVVKED